MLKGRWWPSHKLVPPIQEFFWSSNVCILHHSKSWYWEDKLKHATIERLIQICPTCSSKDSQKPTLLNMRTTVWVALYFSTKLLNLSWWCIFAMPLHFHSCYKLHMHAIQKSFSSNACIMHHSKYWQLEDKSKYATIERLHIHLAQLKTCKNPHFSRMSTTQWAIIRYHLDLQILSFFYVSKIILESLGSEQFRGPKKNLNLSPQVHRL